MACSYNGAGTWSRSYFCSCSTTGATLQCGAFDMNSGGNATADSNHNVNTSNVNCFPGCV
jgi:hypothetical protein